MVAQKRTETCMTVLAEARLAAAVGKSSERRLGMKASLWHWNENTMFRNQYGQTDCIINNFVHNCGTLTPLSNAMLRIHCYL